MSSVMHQVRCAACGTDQPLATATDGTSARPQEGDITVCHDCESVLRFTKTGTAIQPLDELDAETREGIREALAMVHAVKLRTGRT